MNNDRGSDLGGWIITIIMLAVFPPVGIFLLFRQLMGYGRRGQTRKRHPYDIQQEQQGYHAEYEYHYSGDPAQSKGAKASGSGRSAPKKQKAPRNPAQLNLARGKVMTWVGGGLAALFGLAGVSQLLEYLSWGGLRYAWSELFWLFSFCVAGLVILYAGLARTKKGRRFQKYLNTIGRQQKVSVATLAETMGLPVHKVYDDLDEMLERGLFPVGYLDRAGGMLVLSDEGVKEAPKPESKTAAEEAQEDSAILREIREVNDAIPDPVMSQKIDRIGEITGKILDYQRKNPGKDAELRSFLDYYLPTTLKILRAYAQLDAQGINGENIHAAKQRIEGMMDKVVEGFEKQLDKLFQTETLDITSDVQVLEQMLQKDGLSGDGGMTLGV